MSDPFVCWDAETYYDPATKYSLSSMSTSDYIRDARFRLLGFGMLVGLEEGKQARYFQGDGLLRDPTFKARLESSIVIAHNAQFDCAILNWHYGIRPKGIICTLSMARALGLSVTVGGSLAALCKHFNLGEKAPLRPDSTPEELALRGAIDAELTVKLYKILARGFPPQEYKLIDHNVRQFTEPTLYLDGPRAKAYGEKLRADVDAQLTALGVDATELASSSLFASRLESMGVDVPMKTSPSGNLIPALAKGDEGMKELLEHEDPVVCALAAARLGVKSSGDVTRAERYARMASQGPCPVFYNYYGAHTGRKSGGDGTNFANLKRGGELRQCVLPPSGHHLVAGDLSQIEARITAWLAGQADLLSGFAEGRDVYCEFASYAFNKTVTPADKFERFTGKTTVLGGGFGVGKKTYRTQVNAMIREMNRKGNDFAPLSEALAGEIIDAYRARYSMIPELWRRAEHMATHPGTTLGPCVSEVNAILLPNGLRLHYPGLNKEHWITKTGEEKFGWRYDTRKGRASIWGGTWVENMVQSLARILIFDMQARLMPYWTLPMDTYDELVIVCKDSEVEAAKAALQRVMTTGPAWAAGIPLACEIGAGKTYGDT